MGVKEIQYFERIEENTDVLQNKIGMQNLRT